MDLSALGQSWPPSLSETAAVVTIALAAVTLLGVTRRLLVAVWTGRRFFSLQLPGVYSGERDNLATGGWLFEAIILRFRLGHIVGRSLYVHRPGESYTLRALPSKEHSTRACALQDWRD